MSTEQQQQQQQKAEEHLDVDNLYNNIIQEFKDNSKEQVVDTKEENKSADSGKVEDKNQQSSETAGSSTQTSSQTVSQTTTTLVDQEISAAVKQQKMINEALGKYYSEFSDDTKQAVPDTILKVLQEQSVRIHNGALQHASALLQQALPQLLEQYLAQRDSRSKVESTFYSEFPQLQNNPTAESTIKTIGQSLMALPEMRAKTQQEKMLAVGIAACVALGLDPVPKSKKGNNETQSNLLPNGLGTTDTGNRPTKTGGASNSAPSVPQTNNEDWINTLFTQMQG
jgi:hypothetical protein